MTVIVMSVDFDRSGRKPIAVKVGNVRVRIYRTQSRGYPIFQVADYSGGARKLITFGCEEEARRKASEIATKLANREGAVLNLTNADRAAYLRSLELLKPTALPLETAVAQFAEAHKRLGGRALLEAVDNYVRQNPTSLPRRTVFELFQEMLKAKRDEGLSERYLQDLESRVGMFAESFQCQVSDVTGSQIRQWIQAMDVSNRTRNNFRLAIQTLFSYGKAQKCLPKDWNEMESVPTWKTKEEAVEIFAPNEMAILLSTARGNLIPFLAIGAFAGLRSAEIARLDWSKVNLSTGYITVDASIAKTNSRRLVPVLPNLKAWLEPHVKDAGLIVELLNLPNAIQRLVEATRAPERENPDKLSPPLVPWRHNALRHSFCSYRLADIKNAAQVALLLHA